MRYTDDYDSLRDDGLGPARGVLNGLWIALVLYLIGIAIWVL